MPKLYICDRCGNKMGWTGYYFRNFKMWKPFNGMYTTIWKWHICSDCHEAICEFATTAPNQEEAGDDA